MKYLSFLLLITLFLTSCGEELAPQTPPQVSPVKTEVSVPVVEKEIAPIVESNSGVTEKTVSGALSSSGSTNEISFSDAQIQDILAKIDANTKSWWEKVNNSKEILTQGDFKAEYVAPKDYSRDTDKIITTIQEGNYQFIGTYGKENIIRILKCTKLQRNISFEDITKNGECPFSNFGGFIEFSPSGNYLFYSVGFWGTSGYRMVDARTGKVIFSAGQIGFQGWTNDRQEFVIGTSYQDSGGYNANFGGKNNPGLYMTKKGKFPEISIIQNNYNVTGGYLDDQYIYTTGYLYLENGESLVKLIIYSLSTLKEVFSKEIK